MIPSTKKYSDIPGDQRRETTQPATSADGREWQCGTVVTLHSGGYSNPDRCRYADLSIRGEQVRFLDRSQS